MIAQVLTPTQQVAVEWPCQEPATGRIIQNAEGVFEASQTRRYFVQITRQVLDRELDQAVWEAEEMDLLVPAGLYQGRGEMANIERHIQTRWPGWSLQGILSPLDAGEIDEF